MSQLIDLYQNHKGKITDRWFSYISQHEHLFQSFLNNPICFLEIGVQNGGSFEHLYSVEFINSQCIVRKRVAKKNILGSQVVVGVHEDVTSGALNQHKAMITVLDQKSNPWSDPRVFQIIEQNERHATRFCLNEQGVEEFSSCEEFYDLRVVKLNHAIKEIEKEFEKELEDATTRYNLEHDNLRYQLSNLQELLERRDNQISLFLGCRTSQWYN